MRKVMILAALTAVLLACQKNETDNTAPVKREAPVFYASFADTKAGFNYDSGEKLYTHYWDLNDEVAIYAKTSKCDLYKVTNAAGGVLELVSAHAGEPKYQNEYIYTNNIAVYPASYAYEETPAENDRIYVNFPPDSPEFDASSPVYGYENLLLASSTDEKLSFSSYVGWLKVSLKGDFAIKNIRITGNNSEILASDGIQFYHYGDHTFGSLGAGYVYYSRNIRFKAPYPTLSTSSYTDFYITLQRNYKLSKGYTLVITKADDTEVTIVNRSDTPFAYNKVTPTVPISINEYETIAATNNLGSKPANCYVVSAAGDYRFRAVKGNTSTPVGDVASVSVLWETDNSYTPVSEGDIIESATYYPDFNYIVISTPDVFKEGNALVAAKDSEGNILWSWHIWCTDKPADITLSSGGQTTTFMDRNLGALSATMGDGLITHGLYYFWGRKDPFYLSNSNSYSAFARVRGTVELPTARYADAAKGTIEYITAHPTEIIAAGDSYIYPWFAEVPASPWWSNTKTIYDPCPPGYVTYNNNTTSTNIFYILRDAGKISYGGSGNFFYAVVTDDTNSLWLPAAGSASASSPNIGVKSGTGKYSGNYWNGPNLGDFTGKCYSYSCYIDDALAEPSFSVLLGTVTPYYLFSVRCQKQP